MWSGALAPILAPSVALAEARPVHREDVVLTGRQVVHRVSVDAGASEDPASVLFHLRTSAQVDETASMVRLSVDGTPRASVSLEKALEVQGWNVELGRLDPGAHRLELEATLVPRRGDCVRDELGLWLVIDSDSQINHAGGGSNPIPLRELPARWRAMAPQSVAVLASSGGARAAKAAVRADHMLRSWGLEVEHDEVPSVGPTRPRVEFATRATAPASWVELDSRLDEVPGALGVVEATSSELRILARSDEGLPQVVRTLGSAQFRQLCGADACLVPDTGEGRGARRDPAPRPSDVVVTMASAGFPDGWQASGEGRHGLAFDWSPPAGAVIERWPVLYVPVRWSGGEAAAGSVLSVRIAGRGVASFDLEDFEANETTELAVRIPKAWWSRTTWPIELEVSLQGDGDRCSDRPRSLPWLVVEPEARLQVPHAAPAPTGIAGWFAGRLEDGVTVPVAWTPTANPSQTRQVAALLYPLSVAGGGPGYSFLQRDRSDGPAVRVLMEPSSGSGIRPSGSGSTAHWIDEAGVFGMPLVSSNRVAYLGLADQGLEFVPARHVEQAPVPPLGGMIGRKALLTSDARWESFDIPTQPKPGASASRDVSSRVDNTSAPASRESSARRMLDLLWLVGSAVIVGLVILILRRRAAR